MRYEVKALRGDERLGEWVLDALDAADATRQLRDQGYTVVAVRAQTQFFGTWRRAHPFPLVLFSQELLALLEAGLALVDALETLAEKETRPEVRQTLTQIIASLYEGQPLSRALERCTANFPALYIATIRASERTGDLTEALARFIQYQLQMDAVKRQVVSASIYPLLLAAVGGLVTVFLMVYVVPRFSHIYADVGSDLPLMSQWLMQWGLLLESHGGAVLAVALLLGGLVAHGVTRPATRQALARALWRVPGVGRQLHLYQLARFYRSLGMLLRGGMPVVPSLELVSGLLEGGLRARLTDASARIREGHPISVAMEQHGLTTAVALRMLRVGEHTGRMGEMMERAAAFHEDETARWVERFTKLFEPLLMTVIGAVIGLIVVLMYFPIFELAGSIE